MERWAIIDMLAVLRLMRLVTANTQIYHLSSEPSLQSVK